MPTICPKPKFPPFTSSPLTAAGKMTAPVDMPQQSSASLQGEYYKIMTSIYNAKPLPVSLFLYPSKVVFPTYFLNGTSPQTTRSLPPTISCAYRRRLKIAVTVAKTEIRLVCSAREYYAYKKNTICPTPCTRSYHIYIGWWFFIFSSRNISENALEFLIYVFRYLGDGAWSPPADTDQHPRNDLTFGIISDRKFNP